MDTKRYIIEIPDNTAWIQWVKVSDKDGHVCFDFKDPEDLTPYTELDLDAVRNEAYEKGVQDTKQYWVDAPRSCAYKLGYENGLNDAWDAARKIVLSREDGGLFNYESRKAVLGCGNYMALKKFLAQEVIEKIRQYEQKQEKIKVGDEVINDEDIKGVTVDMDDYLLHVLDENGVIQAWPREDVVKTGRHFPEIAEVIKTMQDKTMQEKES